MSGVLCEDCQGYFQTSEHPCGVKLQKEVNTLQNEIMARDTKPDFERGEYHGQDQMLIHIVKLREDNNSMLAKAVRDCPMFKDRCTVLRQVAETLETAGFMLGEPHDPEAAKAHQVELGILQKRAALFGIDETKVGL
jgi:hypothetical protein